MSDLASEQTVSFTRRPQMLPADLRPDWRLAYLVLILSRCRGRVATFRQLAFLNQALLNEARRSRFPAIVGGAVDLDESLLKYEPAFLRSVRLGVGVGVMTFPREGRIALTSDGIDVARTLVESNVFADELAVLAEAGVVTQSLVEGLLR